jgi:hypothetical protein
MFEKVKNRYKISLDDSSFNIILESKEYKRIILCDDALTRNYIFKRLGGKTINEEMKIILMKPKFNLLSIIYNFFFINLF